MQVENILFVHFLAAYLLLQRKFLCGLQRDKNLKQEEKQNDTKTNKQKRFLKKM